VIRRSPNGTTRAGTTCHPHGEFIAMWQPTRGTETSKYPEEKKANSDSPSSGERTGISLNRSSVSVLALLDRGRGISWRAQHSSQRVTKVRLNGTVLEWPAIDGDSPVCEKSSSREKHPSTAGHVLSGGNLGGPSSKAKHYSSTDSELVPRGKGEKNPG
jgi:hypothetical protein